MNLAIVTPFYNPCGYSRIRENHLAYVSQFEQWGIRDHLYTIELVLDQDAPIGCDLVYHGKRPDHFLWQKESMINCVVSQLSSKYDAVAWIDGDILFDGPSWIEQLERSLGTYRAVQLFEYADLLDEKQQPILHRKSVVACKKEGTHAQGAWGMAWAMRREDFSSLPWFFVAGGGDVHAGKAFMGLSPSNFGNAHHIAREYRTWTKQQRVRAMKEVSWLSQTRIRHLFHGDRKNRRYLYRDTLLQRHRFEPHRDVIQDAQNAFATCRWTDTETPLAKEVRKWFTQRKEDQ